MRSFYHVLLLVGLHTVTGVKDNDDPCDRGNYVIVHEEFRRSTGYVRPAGEDPLCDRFIANDVWFRFTGRQGTDMPTQPPPAIGRCGTQLPIWLKGKLPTDEEEVVAVACVFTPGNDCEKQYQIKIKNCCDFNVYKLAHTTGCHEAYCVGTEVPCPDDLASPTGYTPGCTDGDFPTLDNDPVITAGVAKDAEGWDEIEMSCNIVHKEKNVVFDVKWFVENELVHEQKSLTAVPFTIREKKLKLNAVLKCVVYPKYEGSNLMGRPREATYFMGFEVKTRFFQLIEGGDPAVYEIRPTVPVLCAKYFNPPCNLDVLLNQPKNTNDFPAVCGNVVDEKTKQLKLVDQIQFEATACGMTIPRTVDISTVFRIKMIATKDNVYEQAQTVIANFETGKDLTISSLWHKYVLPPATVTVIDSTFPVKNKFCRAINDPHMTTFDGRRYEHQFEGEFVMYRHKTLPIEVQAYFKRPTPRTGYTNVCGGAVRSGGDVFIYDFCRPGHPSRIKLYHCKSGGLKVVKKGGGYEVILPTSTRVVFTKTQILIYPSSSDYESTEGLCGTLTNNCRDDFLTTTGQHIPADGGACGASAAFHPKQFSLSWRVPPERSLYKGQNPEDPKPADVQYCTCVGKGRDAKAVCGTMGQTAPVCVPSDKTDKHTQRCLSRKKRSPDNVLDDDVEEEVELFEFDPTFEAPNPEWSDGWTEQSARQECVNYIQEKSGTQACMKEGVGKVEEAIEACMEDIKITSDTDYSIAHLDGVLSVCQDEITRNMSYYSFVNDTSESDTNETMVMQTPAFLLKDVCPADCSEQGGCNGGKCQCDEGFTGVDCSEEEGKVPELYDIPFKGLCDKQQRPCAMTPVNGYYFIESERLMCRVTSSKLMLDGSLIPTVSEESLADFDHSQRLFCPLNPVYKRSGEPVLAEKYSISISNDGEVFSSEKHIIIYDSKCINCSQGGDCVQKESTCYIDGQCYSTGETSTDKPCAKCDPQMSATDWTDIDNCVSAGHTVATPSIIFSIVMLLIATLTCHNTINFPTFDL